MSDSSIQSIIHRAVSDVLEAALPDLRARLSERLERELGSEAPSAAEGASPSQPATERLLAAVASIHDVSTQSDILGALLAGSEHFCGRSALLVIRRDGARLWRARGFQNDALSDFVFSGEPPLLARALQTGQPTAAVVAEMGEDFVAAAGSPGDGNAILLPLVMNGRVAALLYADAGLTGLRPDAAALQVLVRATAVWIELAGLRKAGHAEPATAEEPRGATVETEVQPAESPAADAEQHAEPESAQAPAAMAAAAGVSGEPAVASNPEIHRKALRFARLLVDEIKLYNKEKVAQGRRSKDLYDRLREDIEKSRATYDKRFAHSEAASADYFNQELIRILADNDPTLLGGGFRQ